MSLLGPETERGKMVPFIPTALHRRATAPHPETPLHIAVPCPSGIVPGLCAYTALPYISERVRAGSHNFNKTVLGQYLR